MRICQNPFADNILGAGATCGVIDDDNLDKTPAIKSVLIWSRCRQQLTLRTDLTGSTVMQEELSVLCVSHVLFDVLDDYLAMDKLVSAMSNVYNKTCLGEMEKKCMFVYMLVGVLFMMLLYITLSSR